MRFGWLVFVSLLGGVLLAGCASRPPAVIADVPEAIPALMVVRADPDAWLGREVRWGGVIAGVENRQDHTVVEVVSRPLDGRGRPRQVDVSEGRFLAHVQGFLDPLVYVEGREFTVTGRVEGVVHRPIGEYRYAFPLILTTGTHLWSPRPEPTRDPYHHYPPPFHSPLYDPWYPFYHPYYRPWRY
ncbi:Slp family lipoprotein [Ectothiorhodospira lacustris]|uniref:Slp family lipoprotein n=1 Tax=Ectothiorhodospira lacustris TaxID=2899127 RepID=UPI001EE910A5|nr:Slp family lipoprotein [Ectothiorhodospira lacustris]MCG5500752.1 Slp family lipoprotein [Ectothiorhodospira lacustris]MCG5510888.1 Slp family lipoprotein [Ectothiorhodospira lacustris]MCG5522566.1 Slp family lipoprotein [Ectothiorhodospira lacustris]